MCHLLSIWKKTVCEPISKDNSCNMYMCVTRQYNKPVTVEDFVNMALHVTSLFFSPVQNRSPLLETHLHMYENEIQ